MKRNYDLISDYLVINQLINKQKSYYINNNIYSLKEKGLSKSRNRALEFCNSDIALISDDDVIYLENIEDIITKAFYKNPEADIITFQFLKDENTLYKKNYKEKKIWHNIYSLARVSSVEIAFRMDKIKNKSIKFDENFGLGSIFTTGEEYVFLSDALKKGLKILYLPIPILIHPDQSSGGQFFDNSLLIESKGALFYRIFGLKSYLVSLIFAFKKYKQSNMSFFGFYKLMINGIKKYKGLKEKNEK
jgi:glycosyltransferase involved in cell wall biosynthesis